MIVENVVILNYGARLHSELGLWKNKLRLALLFVFSDVLA